MTRSATFVELFDLLIYRFFFLIWFAALLVLFLVSEYDTSEQGDLCGGLGWDVDPDLVGGLHLARPRMMSQKAVAIGLLGFDTDFG